MPKAKGTAGGSKASSKSSKPAFIRNQEPYGDPISETIIRGQKAEMRMMSAYTKTWLKAQETKLNRVRRELSRLDKALAKLSRD